VSTLLTASAPGKLVLTGEYAVLENAPAVSAATNLRATVELGLTTEDKHELHVLNTSAVYRFTVSDRGELQWLDAPGEHGTLLTAAAQVIDLQPAFNDGQHVTISIDTRDFYRLSQTGDPVKKGIGSSAAIAVALTAALQKFVGTEADINTALELHQSFQGSRGSGIDIVTSWHGGLVEMQPGNPPCVQKLHWPEGLQVLPVWTGQAASTTDKLRQLEDFRANNPAVCQQQFAALCAASASAAQCWQSTDVTELLAAISSFAETLKNFDAAASLGIWSDVHGRLQALAAECGVIYKPSGAGGGDYGLAFAAEVSGIRQFEAAVLAEGFVTDDVEWGESGLLLTTR
jgi:phosphomevalonate kinase